MTQNKVPGPNLGSVTITGTVTEQQAQTANVATTWTSATALNAPTATYAATNFGTANVGVRVPTTTTAGAVTIEVSQDGTDWVPVPAIRQDNGLAENPVLLPYFPGTNGTRVYAFSIDAFTQIRVRLSTVIVGAGNVVVTIGAVAGGIEPLITDRPRQVATYCANFRLAVATAAATHLSWTPVANTDKQLATIYHAAASTRTVRLRRVSVMAAFTNAAEYQFELRRLSAATAPATGNPVITPAPADSSDPAAEATCLALPTTAGSEAAPDRPVSTTFSLNSGAGAAQTTTYGADGTELVLYDGWALTERKPLAIRAGVAEGFAIIGRATAVSVPALTAFIEFTEELP